MFLYCPNCQNLIDKEVEANHPEGTTINVECRRCYKTVSYFVKYKPVGKITGSVFDKEPAPQV